MPRGGPDGRMTVVSTPARPGMPVPTPEDTPQSYWDGFYAGLPPRDDLPTPNALFAEEAADLSPGRALDLGCGFGGDAIWMAGRGWKVVAVDVSGEALTRARSAAEQAGVEVDWQRHDLTATFPDGAFDLVCTQFLHSPTELPGQRDAILRRAMDAVVAGGSLLVTGHAGLPPTMKDTPFDVGLPGLDELRAALDPDPALWTEATARSTTREVVGPDGTPFTREDTLLRLVRGA